MVALRAAFTVAGGTVRTSRPTPTEPLAPLTFSTTAFCPSGSRILFGSDWGGQAIVDTENANWVTHYTRDNAGRVLVRGTRIEAVDGRVAVCQQVKALEVQYRVTNGGHNHPLPGGGRRLPRHALHHQSICSSKSLLPVRGAYCRGCVKSRTCLRGVQSG